MCFWIHSKYREAITATKDIRCWKVTYGKYLNNVNFLSQYQEFPYKFGETYKTTIKGDFISIDEGFHSYSCKPYSSHSGVTIYCKIPKGSKYYYNPEFNEYVSNQIIPIKVVRNKYYE